MTTIHQFTLPGRSLAYCWSHTPTPSPLVVLHGLGDSSIHTYTPRFRRTALRDTSALFIDLPGFGEAESDDHYPATIEAMAADVGRLLVELEIYSAPIFAHSMGANVAIMLAHSSPEHVAELVLGEPLLRPEDSILAGSITRHTEESFVARGYRMLERATSIQMQRADAAAAAFLTTLRLANPTSMYRSAASLVSGRDPSFLAMVSALNVPTTLLVGSRTNTDTTQVEQMGIDIIRIAEAGHSMIAEAEHSTACAILEVVNQMHHGGHKL